MNKKSTSIRRAVRGMAAAVLLGGAASPVALAQVESHLPEAVDYSEASDPPPPVSAPCFGDQRTPLARDSRVGVGRISTNNAFCTAFILSNGAFVTAGHCVDSNSDGLVDTSFLNGVVQFNVPDSTSDGCSQTDASTRSYGINNVIDFQLVEIFGFSIPAKDWAVFSVNPDGLGVEAATVEGFFRPDDGGPIPFSTLRVTGCGNDTHPDNGGACNGNSNAFTLQTGTGILEFNLFNEIGHRVDTEGGTSGGPIIQESTGRVIGIHNTSLCELEAFNTGVSFTKNNLADAIKLVSRSQRHPSRSRSRQRR